MNNEQDEPKIIVDDDWKEQVQKEKESLQEQADEPPMQEMPPASFEFLVQSFASQALAAMGLFPDPATGQATTHLPMAKHVIDTLGMLEEKTSGNLDDGEKQLLNEALHQLRMAFVMAGKSSANESSPDDPSSPTIELP